MRSVLAATVLALATSSLLAAPSASAADFFEIRSDLHNKCLTTNGDNVEMRTCDGTGRQVWFWDGPKLRNLAERHCLDVKHGQINAAVQAVGDCHGNANQRWSFQGRRIHTDVNGQVLSIQNNGDTRDGAGINMRNYVGGAWQHWSTRRI
ncbi:RICIN domain-containing protein [Streptoalloteichus hindustanus]|uniref:Ricin-type beta-trefoil lectin domain-containing protein n=1 Tax=Streptoalloteichus hindustanus TaxID=2017 RepID=A0A1M5MTP3_STRHI|nr:ricin-type beta-trefoil lectin domain protein [Streptoalloteichus hindustanus]SHG80734.1 Ricin-type beta-trefoil lectin domain-containing protein [Streptoalloteichus hindustanus]